MRTPSGGEAREVRESDANTPHSTQGSAVSLGKKTSPGGAIKQATFCSLAGCSAATGRGGGGFRPEPRSGGRQSQSRGESGLRSAGQRASKRQHQVRLSGQPRAWMSAGASGRTRGREGSRGRRDFGGLQGDGWLPGGLTTGGRAGPAQPQPPGPE